ncbi:hypothetical protein HTIA_2170 [Halorhabdus tiamatea SARL4B]|uniref:Uncharacterized protein n=1 Tax=Halorhabdus tiamatea SARL4B TaxID=1033806 RepID=S6CV67_9EURY|nr:hypothetical protein HTIA_2170 [Halorhabdus tiamatea SARL4B]
MSTDNEGLDSDRDSIQNSTRRLSTGVFSAFRDESNGYHSPPPG